MSHVLTAEDLLSEMKAMPSAERGRFFALLGSDFFKDDNSQMFSTHDLKAFKRSLRDVKG